MNKMNIYLVAGIASCVVAACNTTKKLPVTPAGELKTESLDQTEVVIEKVIFGEWAITSVGSQKIEGTDIPYILFSADETNPFLAQCSAYDGCNYINGVYAITPGGHLKRASEIISTLKMCPDAPYEMGINLALNNVTSYSIDDNNGDYILHFKDNGGNNLMTLRKYDISFINGAWQVTDIEGTSVSPEVEMSLVIDTPELRLHGNAGCNTLNGSVKIDLTNKNAISFNNIITTRMMCPNINLEQQLLASLSKVTTAVPGNNNEIARLKDSNGKVVITLKRLNLK